MFQNFENCSFAPQYALILHLEDFCAVEKNFRVEDYAKDDKSVECGIKMHSE